jgi:hypothetical protein
MAGSMYIIVCFKNSENHLGFLRQALCNVLRQGFRIDNLSLFLFFYFQLFAGISHFTRMQDSVLRG